MFNFPFDNSKNNAQTASAYMEKAVALFKANRQMRTPENGKAIIEALKLFVEANKLVDKEIEQEGRVPALKPKVLMFISWCNWLIGNIIPSYVIAHYGLRAVKQAMDDSMFTGFTPEHYGADNMHAIIADIKKNFKRPLPEDIDELGIDENVINTNNYELSHGVYISPGNRNNPRSRECLEAVIAKYDALRGQLMVTSYENGGMEVMAIMAKALIPLHELAAPVFFAWQYWGHGNMYDFWPEDRALGVFERFKQDPVGKTIMQYLNIRKKNQFFADIVDIDGSLKLYHQRILNALVDDFE